MAAVLAQHLGVQNPHPSKQQNYHGHLECQGDGCRKEQQKIDEFFQSVLLGEIAGGARWNGAHFQSPVGTRGIEGNVQL